MNQATQGESQLGDYKEWVKRCGTQTGYFQEHVLGQKLWRGQREIIRSTKRHRRTLVRSAHGTGKSHALAGLILEFCSLPHVWAPSLPHHSPKVRLVATASTQRQLEDVLWGEVRKQYFGAKVPLGGRMLTKEWKIAEGRNALTLSVGDPVAMHGKHAEAVFIVVDEGEAVDRETYDALDSLMTNEDAWLIVVYNPVRSDGYIAEQSHRPELWNIIHLDGIDHPNVVHGREFIPGAITRGWVREMLLKHAHVTDALERPWEGPDGLEALVRSGAFDDNPFICARVRGQHPEGGSNAIVTITDLQRVEGRNTLDVPEERHVGVDPARFGDDKTVATVTDEHRNIITVQARTQMKTTETASWVADLAREYEIAPKNIHIEEDGLGGGVIDALSDGPHFIQCDAVSMGGGPKGDWDGALGDVKFGNRRAELWWVAREVIRGKATSVPAKWTETWADLCAPEYDTDLLGKIVVTPRKKLVEQLGRSPDWGTSFVLSLSRTGSKGLALYFG